MDPGRLAIAQALKMRFTEISYRQNWPPSARVPGAIADGISPIVMGYSGPYLHALVNPCGVFLRRLARATPFHGAFRQTRSSPEARQARKIDRRNPYGPGSLAD